MKKHQQNSPLPSSWGLPQSATKPPRPSGTPPFQRRGILLFSLLLFSFLLFSGCKKEKENKPDPGGGGTEKLSPPAWIQGNWKMKSTGYVFKFSSNNVIIDIGLSSVGFVEYTAMLFGNEEYTVKENTGTTLYTLRFDMAGGQGVQGGKTYLYSFKKLNDNSIEYAQFANGKKEKAEVLDKNDGGGGGEEVKLTGIKFENSECAIVKGNSAYVTLLPVPATASLPKCNLTSDNVNIVTVNSYGMVTGVAVGQTTIKATSEDGKFNASIPVVVLEGTPEEDKLTGITFDKSEYSVPVGSAFIAELLPVPYTASLPNCVFSSDNSTIATVNSDGMVTAVAAGQTVIRATTTDGNNFKASLTLTVTPNIVNLTGIKFENSQISIPLGNPVGTVFNTTLLPVPSTATLPICNYSSDNPAIATVNSAGIITAVAIGQTTIRATTADGNHFTASLMLTITEPQGEFTYKEPYLIFGSKKPAVKKYETREMYKEDSNRIWYHGENKYVDNVSYLFSDEEGFFCSVVRLHIYSNTETQAKEFLSKKYQYQGWFVGGEDEIDSHQFLSNDGKIKVLLFKVDEINRWVVNYVVNQNPPGEKSAQNDMGKILPYSAFKK